MQTGWTCTAAAEMFMVAAKTAAKWAQRYRDEGPAGMADRSSRPLHSPARTPEHLARHLRRAGNHSETHPALSAVLPSRLHFYNHHRPHSSTGGKPPLTRLTNLPEHHD
ncbi:leucine zipper domain-containing protein [Amycolatopsis thermoflava]